MDTQSNNTNDGTKLPSRVDDSLSSAEVSSLANNGSDQPRQKEAGGKDGDNSELIQQDISISPNSSPQYRNVCTTSNTIDKNKHICFEPNQTTNKTVDCARNVSPDQKSYLESSSSIAFDSSMESSIVKSVEGVDHGEASSSRHVDNQRTQSLQLTTCSSSHVPLNQLSLDSQPPVFTATSTPEMCTVVTPNEGVTCSTLNAQHNTSSSVVKINIHQAPSSVEYVSVSPPTASTSATTSTNVAAFKKTTTQGAPFNYQPTSFIKTISGKTASKVERRRASSNAATSGGGGGSGRPHQSASTLSTQHCAAMPNSARRKSWDLRIPGPIRRASQVFIHFASSASGDNVSMCSYGPSYGECSRRDSRVRSVEIKLMYSSFQRIPMKDFGAEVRASMDVDQFLQQAVLLLDITETSLEGIVDRMLRKVCSPGVSFYFDQST